MPTLPPPWRAPSYAGLVHGLVGRALVLLLAGALPAAHAAPASTGEAPDPQHGQLLLARYHCGSCHTIPGVAASRGSLAAPLQGFGRRSYIAGRVANTAPLLAQWIQKPQSLIPDTAMPDMGVSARDARDMAAYLLTLR